MSNIRKDFFLRAYEKCLGNVSRACKTAKVSRNSVYRWRKGDADFKDAMDAMSESLLDAQEEALHNLAIGGILIEKKERFDENGKLIECIEKRTQPSAVALIFSLTNRRSGKWKDRRALVNNTNIVANQNTPNGKDDDVKFSDREETVRQELKDFIEEAEKEFGE